MTPAQFRKERQAFITRIKKLIKPFLWESGYVHRENRGANGPRRKLKLWVPRDKKGNITNKEYVLPNAFIIEQMLGFSEEGVIVDQYAGGLTTLYFDSLPIEDMFRLENWMIRMLPKLTEYDVQSKAAAKKASKKPVNAPEVRTWQDELASQGMTSRGIRV